MRRALAALAIAMLACGSDDSAAPAAGPALSTATLRFSATPDTKGKVTVPLKGTVYGDVYKTEDVSLTGPRADAVAVSSVEVAIDLGAKDPSDATVVVKSLEAGKYTFLGFLDLNGNGTDQHRPDKGDLATIPVSDVQFTVEAGKNLEATMSFNLLYGG